MNHLLGTLSSALLGPEDLFLALALVLAGIVLSARQGLGLTQVWLVAIGRAFLQLLAAGYLLALALSASWPNGLDDSDTLATAQWQPTAIGLGLLLVLAVTGAFQQTRRRDRQVLPWLALGLGVGTAVAATPVVVLILHGRGAAQIWLPIAALILVVASHGVAIALDTYGDLLRSRRREVECRLALGATPAQAIAPIHQASLRAGLGPILTSATSTGLFFVPALVAGLILAGVDPLTAVGLQFVLLCATGLAVIVAVSIVLAGAERASFTPIGSLQSDGATEGRL